MATRTDDEAAEHADGTVQLLVDHEGNRRALARELSADHAVVETAPDDLGAASFDLCILDPGAFESHREALAAKKRAADPVFLPYVLLVDRDRVERLPGAVREAVDEVLTVPVATAELATRLENLLERRRLSLELQRRSERNERRFRTLFDTAPDPIVVTEPDGTISEANESFSRAVQASPEALAGHSVTDVGFTPDDAIERVLLRVVDGGSGPDAASSTVELDRDGGSRVLDVNADAVTALADGAERIGVFRDVTEREHREAELRRQNERLETFASTIAHDLRNPLSIAQGHLELARGSGADRHFEAVETAHDRMEQLIDEILTLARRGQLVMDPEPVSLEAVATEAWENVATEAATLVVEDTVDILADRGRLAECLENLFRNSVEHGSTGSRPEADDGRESVALASQPDSRGESGDAVEHGSTGSQNAERSDDTVEHGSTGSRPAATENDEARVTVRVGTVDGDERGFFVADDGPGIPESDRGDVFEAGYTDAEDGTGFGLSIVRQVVEGHGWEVNVTESDDGGARFEVVGAESA